MIFKQSELQLSPRERGFHLITEEVETVVDIRQIKVGMLQVFIQHTSASLTINENADPTVRMDFESYFNRSVPENASYYRHNYEGSDDMPAHIKSSLLSPYVIIPITNGELNLGT